MQGSALLPSQVPGVHSFVMQLSLVACFQFVDVLASVQSQFITVTVCHIAGKGLQVLVQFFDTCSGCLRKGVSALSCMNAYCAAAQKHLCLARCACIAHAQRARMCTALVATHMSITCV